MSKPVILVTGGSGFLGSHIVDELFADHSPIDPGQVRVLDIKDYKGRQEVVFIRGDVRDEETVMKACEGVDAVIHSAAVIDWGIHTPGYVYDVNVGGTENVLKACHEHGIRYMVFTSSLDAVFTGKPLVDIDDSQPYAEHFHNMYCKSKVLGEGMVKAATDAGLKAAILRPSDIYGPADPYHMNALIGMARSGFYVRLGNGRARQQHVFVNNMAWAHLKVLHEMMNGNDKPVGQAYLITDAEAGNFFRFFDRIILSAGYKIRPKNLWIPRQLAFVLGAVSELMAFLARPVKRFNPGLSRFAVTYTCTDFIFNSKRATEHFGFKPIYSEQEAIAITAAYYRKK